MACVSVPGFLGFELISSTVKRIKIGRWWDLEPESGGVPVQKLCEERSRFSGGDFE